MAASISAGALDGSALRGLVLNRANLTTAQTMTDATFHWTGTHVAGSRACAVVRYSGPTNTRGSRWLATVKRDAQTVWRGSATFEEGPITAALRAAAKAGVSWEALTCHSIDPDTYAVGF
jgi:hypothetical protein